MQIMAVRWGIDDDSDPSVSHRAYWSGNLAAWDYVIGMKRRGVNIRVTANSYAQLGAESIAVREVIEMAAAEGILSVFAAGPQGVNQDLFSTFPGAFNLASIINVTGSSQTDALANESTFGASTIDLAAPGVNILSTSKAPDYETESGASVACPQVAGAAALLLSINSNLTANEIKAALFGSVDQPSAMRGKLVTSGRLNVAQPPQDSQPRRTSRSESHSIVP
ncbi:MAG: hypothetical protein DME26_01480 [Verrucomicrobia bacterium]|nr:MAG: hypothetical protein DME26_01480 [Verrucomicrobiota bacterium]